MMRAIRFATQLGFTIEEFNFWAIKSQCERIRIISGERIADELNKIILPKTINRIYFVRQIRFIALIFPELDKS
jgi:poly(A) polymerase